MYRKAQAQNAIWGLINLCKNSTNIFCYGAGHYGGVIRCFLQNKGIVVKAFLVTNKTRSDPNYVVPWDEIHAKDLDDGLVILSLQERIQDDIEKKILGKCKNVTVFRVTEELFQSLPYEAHNMALVERICRVPYREVTNKLYEERAKYILARYDRIILRYLYTDRIGFLALSWIYYNTINHLGNELWIFYPGPTQRIVNKFLDEKLRAYHGDGLEVIGRNNIAFWQYMLNHYLKNIEVDASCPDVHFFERVNNQISGLDKSTGLRLLELSLEESRCGEEFLKRFQLRDYVVVFARDSLYTKTIISAVNKEDTTVDSYRNFSIENFSLMAKYLQDKMISTVRMGSMPADEAPKGIFDYGRKYHDDFLDVFLCSRCRYFVGTPSGLQHVADLYGKLMVMVNVPVLSTKNNFAFVGGKENLMIIQKYWDTKNQRYLTIRDMLRYEIYGKSGYAPNGPRKTMWLYYENGIESVKNSKEEILAVVQEMEARLSGCANYDEQDMILQKRYDEIISEFTIPGQCFFNYRLGRDFLRDNQWLLE